MAPLRLDPALAAVMAAIPTSPVPSPGPPTVEGIRAMFRGVIGQAYAGHKLPEGMHISSHTAPNLLDGSTVNITRYLPVGLTPSSSSSSTTEQPLQRAVLYIFPGGTIAGSAALMTPDIAARAAATNTQYFATDYRLAPENPYPAAHGDVYSTLVWMQSHARELGIDPARIVLAGKSAGGLLAAGVALYARDKGLSPPVAGLLLQYPMLDDRTVLPEGEVGERLRPFLNWNTETNELGWSSYLGKARADRTDENTPIYASPGRARDLSNLPRTYVDTGALDLFRDESIAFVSRLAAANEEVEFHLFPGVTHGFDTKPSLAASKASEEAQGRFISSF